MGAISKLAARNPEIACWERPGEILMVPLRERSDCAQVATVADMNDEEIRPADAADVAAVKTVTDAAYHPCIARIGVVPQPMEADHAANGAEGRVFITGDPVHGLVVVEEHSDHLLLDGIAVHPDAHGRGVGGRLLRFVDAHSRALGLTEVRLYTNAMTGENRKLCPRFGYEVLERRVDGSYDRVHYRKRLVRGDGPRRQPSGHQVRAMSFRTSWRPEGRSSASSRIRRESDFFRGFCTVARRMAASFSAYRVPRSHGGRRFWGELLIGADLSVVTVTISTGFRAKLRRRLIVSAGCHPVDHGETQGI